MNRIHPLGIHHKDIDIRERCLIKADIELAKMHDRMGALNWNNETSGSKNGRW